MKFPIRARPRSSLAVLLPVALLLAACGHMMIYADPMGPRYLGSFPPAPDPDPALRIVTFNIQYAREIAGAIALLQEDPDLRGADLLFLQEMDAPGTERIAAALGLHYVYYPAVVHPGAGHDLGNAILSRWPIRDEKKVLMPHLARFGGSQRIATAATVDIDGVPVRLYSLHIALPISVGRQGRRDQLGAVLEDAASGPERVIVGGDLNSHDLGEFFANTGFDWLSREIGSTRGWFDLDHVFVRGFRLEGPGIGVVRENRDVSDHRPVWAVLAPDSVRGLPPGRYRFARLDPSVPIRHFAWIDSTLARGGRPEHEGIVELRDRGFRTIVNFTEDDDERREAEAAGLEYVELPMTAHLWSSPPTPEQVRRFFEVVLDPARRPLFMHCVHGKDRTGMMAGVYRIEAEGWQPPAAVEEMQYLGYHDWYDDLVDFVREYVPRGYGAPANGAPSAR